MLYKSVRRGDQRGTIRYDLKLAGGQIAADSVSIGGAPVTGTLKNLLWERLSEALRKVLSPGIEGLQIKSLSQGTMELVAVQVPPDALTGSP